MYQRKVRGIPKPAMLSICIRVYVLLLAIRLTLEGMWIESSSEEHSGMNLNHHFLIRKALIWYYRLNIVF